MSHRTSYSVPREYFNTEEVRMSSKKPRVLLADKLSALVTNELSELCEVYSDSSLSGDALVAKMKEFDPSIIVVRSTKVNANHINANPDLSLIIRAGAGFNTIDVKTASNNGIYVANCPGFVFVFVSFRFVCYAVVYTTPRNNTYV